MSDDIKLSLRNDSSTFKFYSLADAETTVISNKAQLFIFIRGNTSDF